MTDKTSKEQAKQGSEQASADQLYMHQRVDGDRTQQKKAEQIDKINENTQYPVFEFFPKLGERGSEAPPALLQVVGAGGPGLP